MSETQPHPESQQSKPSSKPSSEPSVQGVSAAGESTPLDSKEVFHHHAQPTPKSLPIQFLAKNRSSPPTPDDRTLSPTRWQASVSQAAAIVVQVIEQLRPVTKRLQSWATVGFAAIQQRLPEPWATRMGDRRLVSGIAGLLLIGGWIVFVGLPGSFTQPVDHPTVTAPPPLPAAPVPLQLTPVPPLIASIQAEVAAVVDRYSEGHIQSMQANFRHSRLTVVISGWDDLSPDRQKQLAAELLVRSQSLNFQQLELIDREGAQLARSPVVGTTMVLVGRDYS